MSKRQRLLAPFILVSSAQGDKAALNKEGYFSIDSENLLWGYKLDLPNMTLDSFIRKYSIKLIFKISEKKWVIIKRASFTGSNVAYSVERTLAKAQATGRDYSAKFQEFNLCGGTLRIKNFKQTLVDFADLCGITLPTYAPKAAVPDFSSQNIPDPDASIIQIRGPQAVAPSLPDPEEASLVNATSYKAKERLYDELLGSKNFGEFPNPNEKSGSKTIFLVKTLEGGRIKARRIAERTAYNYLKRGVTRHERLAAIRGNLAHGHTH